MADPKTRAEVIAISNTVADEFRIPRLLLLACGIAEGNLVWNARRPTSAAQDAAFWPDVSGGPWQQTVRYDPDYHGGSAYPGPGEVARVLELQYDTQRSAQLAAGQLKAKWNGQQTDDEMLKAMFLYNWPAGGGKPYTPAHEANYKRGLTEAWAILGATPMPTIKLSDVLARGRSRIGDLYVWDGEVPGGFDCSGFIRWTYNGALTSFTDSILGETERVEKPAPGDIVLYEYQDASQPGVRFPHVGLFLSDTKTLDARFGAGVGEHDQLSRSTATRYYRRMPGVIVDTAGAPPPPSPPPDELATLRAENERLKTVLGYASQDIGAALQKEADAIVAQVGALTAAINTLRSQK
jgi:cell wall-associated NlpC family hydrolase